MKKYLFNFVRNTLKTMKLLPRFFFMIFKALNNFFKESDVSYVDQTRGNINILGNGPSCHSTFQINRSIDDKLMVVNFFAVSDNFVEYKPSYYVLIDPLFFIDDGDRYQELYSRLNKVEWNMTLFLPARYKKKASLLIKNPLINLLTFNYNFYFEDTKLVYSLYKKNLATPRFQNVINACLYLAINKGYTGIKLHGVEFDEFKNFSVDENNDVIKRMEHFYGKSSVNLTLNGTLKKGAFGEYLNYYAIMLKSFSEIKKYSMFMHCKIVNYTKTSFIDSFDKQ